MMKKKDKLVEKRWEEIKKMVIVPADDEIVSVYADGMVTDDDGNLIAQMRGWSRTDPARLKRLSANIIEDDDDDAEPIDVEYEVEKISKLPEYEPRRIPAPKPAPVPEKPVQKSAPETPAPERQDRKVRRARAGGFRLVNGEWVQG